LTNAPRAAPVRACGFRFVDFDLEAFFDFEALPVELAMAAPPCLPGPDVTALQDFAEPGAVLAVLPRGALGRLGACLPN